jgi:NAD(P)-dependent dehydrogenase (short-subunit alcohol dehydrogenase family)
VSIPSTILVTGASSGIGKATATRLADAGHHVYAASRDEAALNHVAEDHRVMPIALDVTDPPSIASVRDRIHAETAGHGPDVVINAAGIAVLGPVEAVPDRHLRRQFDTNLFGTLAVIRAFLPSMRTRRSGRIINVSSVLGRYALPGTGVYAASKYALEAVSDALRVELSPFGIAVVLIEPSIVRTPLYERSATTAAEYLDDLLPYASIFPHGIAFPDKLARTATIADHVGDTIVKAATVKRPKARYVPGARNRFNVRLLTTLPTSATDRIKTRLMDLDTTLHPVAGTDGADATFGRTEEEGATADSNADSGAQ